MAAERGAEIRTSTAVRRVLVEGGCRLAASLLAADLVDRLATRLTEGEGLESERLKAKLG